MEAKRAQEKLKELSDHELKRQLKRMEEKQRDELMQIENIQRSQFEEFTHAWDDYMTQYEQAAFESIERLKNDHEMEIVGLRDDLVGQDTARNAKFTTSKKLIQYRNMEHKTFASKNYDGASYFKYLADELELFERLAHQDKMMEKADKQEKILRKRQENFMINFLKRV